MANWEYAAIVKDGSHWILTQPGETHLFKFKTNPNDGQDSVFVGWQRPLQTRTTVESIESMNAEIRAKNPEVKGRKMTKYDKKGIPNILYESDDIMFLVNMAGAEGWEITGGLGLNDGSWARADQGGPTPESRWRMMRREL